MFAPTSETIIGEMFAKWVQSYRDLPLLINQWANVVRWEMRTRIFLRTTEFLWQEGHTAHATEAEAIDEMNQMLDIYADFVENHMAIPVIKGEKSDSERFPGAVTTVSIEAMMQDRKALQAGTSHFLGQNFSKASNIKFLDADGAEQLAWTTSWGVSTRLLGALVMVHSDDDGLVLPPRIAASHVVIIPVIHGDTRDQVLAYCDELANSLRAQSYHDHQVEVIVDRREGRGGQKFWGWVKKGVPVRIEVGMREIEEGKLSYTRRDKPHRERFDTSKEALINEITGILDDIQRTIFERARKYRDENIVRIDSREEFYAYFTPKNKKKPEAHGGFALAHWNGDPAVEEKIKNDLKVTIRCIPFDQPEEDGKCIITGEPSRKRVIFGKSY